METGIFCAFSGDTPPEVLIERAHAIEARGFRGVWVPEHVVLFNQYASRYPYATDGRLPEFGQGLLEPFTALTFMAAHTTTLRLGTAVCLVPQRNPLYTAKQVADVDFLSGGRLDFGVGVGWLREEFDALGVPWERRGRRARDYIAVMKALWTQSEASAETELFTLPPSVQRPQPVQKPHPPILFGGEGEPALKRVASIGDGWIGAGVGPDNLPERLARLDALLAEAGRTRSEIRVCIMPNRRPDPELVKHYADLGVDEVVFMVIGRDENEWQRRLDALAGMVGLA